MQIWYWPRDAEASYVLDWHHIELCLQWQTTRHQQFT